MMLVVFLWEGGVSIASKRAKERQNRSLGELVTDKTKISRSCYQQCGRCSRWWKTRKQFIKSVVELCFECLLKAVDLLHGLFKIVQHILHLFSHHFLKLIMKLLVC